MTDSHAPAPRPIDDDSPEAILVSTPPKPYLQSLTVWGVLVALVSWGLESLGLSIGSAGADYLLTLVLETAYHLGLGGAVLGLRRAIGPLSGIVRPRQE